MKHEFYEIQKFRNSQARIQMTCDYFLQGICFLFFYFLFLLIELWNWYINNAYRSKILVRNSYSYETENSGNSGIQESSGRNSGIKEAGNSRMTEFNNISEFQHLKILINHQTWILGILGKKRALSFVRVVYNFSSFLKGGNPIGWLISQNML